MQPHRLLPLLIIFCFCLYSVDTEGTRRGRSYNQAYKAARAAEQARKDSGGIHYSETHLARSTREEDLTNFIRAEYKDFDPKDEDVFHLSTSKEFEKDIHYDAKIAAKLFYHEGYSIPESILSANIRIVRELVRIHPESSLKGFHHYLKELIENYKTENNTFNYSGAYKDRGSIERSVLWNYYLVSPRFDLTDSIKDELAQSRLSRYSFLTSNYENIVVKLSDNIRSDSTILNYVWKNFFLLSFNRIDASKINVINTYHEPIGDISYRKIDRYLRENSPRSSEQRLVTSYLENIIKGEIPIDQLELSIMLSRLKGQTVFIIGHINNIGSNPKFVFSEGSQRVETNIQVLTDSFHRAGVNFFPLGCSSCETHWIGLDKPVNNVSLIDNMHKFMLAHKEFTIHELLDNLAPKGLKFVINPLPIRVFDSDHPSSGGVFLPLSLKHRTGEAMIGYGGIFQDVYFKNETQLLGSSSVALALGITKLPVFKNPCIAWNKVYSATKASIFSIIISLGCCYLLYFFCWNRKTFSPLESTTGVLPRGTPNDYVSSILLTIVYSIIISLVICLVLWWLWFDFFYIEKVLSVVLAFLVFALSMEGRRVWYTTKEVNVGGLKCEQHDEVVGFNCISDRESKFVNIVLGASLLFATIGFVSDGYEKEKMDLCLSGGPGNYREASDRYLTYDDIIYIWNDDRGGVKRF